MAGTKKGGQMAAATNKARYGSDFYAKIGAKGGVKGHTAALLQTLNLHVLQVLKVAESAAAKKLSLLTKLRSS